MSLCVGRHGILIAVFVKFAALTAGHLSVFDLLFVVVSILGLFVLLVYAARREINEGRVSIDNLQRRRQVAIVQESRRPRPEPTKPPKPFQG
jgi:lipid-A-disaccharide synthase-like uncharacterized protein